MKVKSESEVTQLCLTLCDPMDCSPTMCKMGFPGSSEVKTSACDAGDLDLIPGLGRSPGEGNDNPFQYSCLENTRDGGA